MSLPFDPNRPKIIVEAYKKEKGPKFLDIPERWLDKPTWRCTKGHVSNMYIKSESKGPICPVCQKPVYYTFPEDKDDV